MSARDEVTRALRLLGAPADVAPASTLADADRQLGNLGLRLAVVEADAPGVQLSDARLILLAIERASTGGAREHGLQRRIAALVGVDPAIIVRVLAGMRELPDDARERLERHLLEPAAHPLPAGSSAGPGRPRKNGGPRSNIR